MKTTQEETIQAVSSAVEEPKRAKKPNVRARKPRVAPAKGKLANNATLGKKGHKSPKATTRTKSAAGVREGSKTAKILDLLKRPGGATLKELMKATGWQPHSVRGFLSGVIGRKLKLKVASIKDDSGERRYSVKS